MARKLTDDVLVPHKNVSGNIEKLRMPRGRALELGYTYEELPYVKSLAGAERHAPFGVEKNVLIIAFIGGLAAGVVIAGAAGLAWVIKNVRPWQ
jgi:hypothetical protein